MPRPLLWGIDGAFALCDAELVWSRSVPARTFRLHHTPSLIIRAGIVTGRRAGEFPELFPTAHMATTSPPSDEYADEAARPPSVPGVDVPLCVDLDGTLVKSDTLLDSVLLIARQRPLALLRIPGWIARGKANFKQEVTSAVALDVEHLPYNRPLLEWLRQEAGRGRALYLATAADRVLAERVAAYLGVFRGVLASDGDTNLAGGNKLEAFRRQFGAHFSYIGNASPDTVLLQASEVPMLANPTRSLRAAFRGASPPLPVFQDRTGALKSWLKAVRLHQWAKNVLLFIPLLLGHAWFRKDSLLSLVAFVSFGLCASGTYILNDLLDVDADRKHPRKSRRPFAAGDLSPLAGVAAVGGLLIVAFALAVLMPRLVLWLPGSAEPLLEPFGFLKWLVVYTRYYPAVFAVPQAQTAAGCVCAERAVHSPYSGWQRGLRCAGIDVAGRFQRVLFPVTGFRKALQRTGGTARERRRRGRARVSGE